MAVALWWVPGHIKMCHNVILMQLSFGNSIVDIMTVVLWQIREWQQDKIILCDFSAHGDFTVKFPNIGHLRVIMWLICDLICWLITRQHTLQLHYGVSKWFSDENHNVISLGHLLGVCYKATITVVFQWSYWMLFTWIKMK